MLACSDLRLSGSGQTEEQGYISIWALVGGRVEGQLAELDRL